jgi:hypothetical protein
MRVLLSSLLLAAVIAGAASAARVGHRVATAGAWRAELTWVEHPGTYPPYTRLHLAVRDAGRLVLDRPVRIGRGVNAPGLQPGGLGFRDLDGDGRDELLVDLFTGGAHCCSITQVFAFDPGTMTYRMVEQDWGDPGYRLVDLRHDGRTEFETADDRFAYEFAPYAFSGLPVQVWTFSNFAFHDVTRSFPGLIAADARIYLHDWPPARAQNLGNGVLAAWAADEYLLGHKALVARKLARALRHHQLGRGPSVVGAPTGKHFIKLLKRFLLKNGYG